MILYSRVWFNTLRYDFGPASTLPPSPFPQFWPSLLIVHTWRANPTDDIATVKTDLKDICIHVKFTFQSQTILDKFQLAFSPSCLVSWNFANKLSTFLLISIILRPLVTMQFFATLAARIMTGSRRAGAD